MKNEDRIFCVAMDLVQVDLLGLALLLRYISATEPGREGRELDQFQGTYILRIL